MMRRKNATETNLVCPECGNIQTIYRKSCKRKRYGHLKLLWCYKCKEVTNHFEICNENIEEAKNEVQV